MIKVGNLVGGIWQTNPKAKTFQTFNPKTKKSISNEFEEASEEQIDQAVEKASSIFEFFSETSFSERIEFLKAIQNELNLKKDEILNIYQLESALPSARAEGEFQRTLGQIQEFIELLALGSFINPIINTNGPDLRKMLFPIGPIAVFGASNFPLAFSTAGGDTISAFAAGCPVIVKAHPFHAGTSALVAEAILNAIEYCSLPLEIFSHLGGMSHNVGSELVNHSALKGVGFTGSFIGGKALYDLAQKREEPIPVFAEMGSVNPIFITEKRLENDKNLSETLAQSIVLGTGQFCTNPGIIIFCDSKGKSDIVTQVNQKLKQMELPPMVHLNIESNYLKKIEDLNNIKGLKIYKQSENIAALGLISASVLLENKELVSEVFGPFSLFVKCSSIKQMNELAKIIPGQLTGTLLSDKNDQVGLKKLVNQIKNKVGRLLFEGVPTGVAVTKAMQHGGPYPASTDGRFTSVGTDSIYRWLRPIVFQDCPNVLLPSALKDENPLALERSVNGQMTKKAI